MSHQPTLGHPAAAAEPSSTVPRLFDLDLRAHTAHGLHDTPALVVIRPDGHTGFRRSAADVLDLHRDVEQPTENEQSRP